MKRDYKARSGELADAVRLVSTQARQILHMKRALALKPWADHRDSEIRTLNQQLADQATALATKTTENNKLEADNAKLKDENGAYLLYTKEIELELLKMKADIIMPPLPLIPRPVPDVGPQGIAALLETHDSLFWYRLAKQHEDETKRVKVQLDNTMRNHIAQTQKIEAQMKDDVNSLVEKHKTQIDAKSKTISGLCAQLHAT